MRIAILDACTSAAISENSSNNIETPLEDELAPNIDIQTTPTVTLPNEPKAISSDDFTCNQCSSNFNSFDKYSKHRQVCHPNNLPEAPEMCDDFDCESCSLTPADSAMNGILRSIIITPSQQCITADQFISNTREGIQHVLQYGLTNGETLKVFSATAVTMHMVNLADGTVDIEKTFYFTTKAIPIQSNVDISDFIDKVKEKIEKQIDKFTNHGSNWVVASIDNLRLSLVKYKVLRGGAPNFVVPRELKAKKCVLNIELEGQECFKYALVASLHHSQIADNKNRKTNYDQFVQQYDFSDITFPATANDICKFQKQNKGVAINALLYNRAEGDKLASVVPIYHPPHSIAKDRQMATILLVNDHWLAVTSLNRLLSEHHAAGVIDDMAFCYRCLKNLYHPSRLDIHMKVL